jgi:hypothetical protein
MQLFRRGQPRWQLVEELEREAFDRWRNEHSPGYAMADVLALSLTSLNTTVSAKPGGNVWVTVSFVSRDAWRSDTYSFRLQMTEKGRFIRHPRDSTPTRR